MAFPKYNFSYSLLYVTIRNSQFQCSIVVMAHNTLKRYPSIPHREGKIGYRRGPAEQRYRVADKRALSDLDWERVTAASEDQALIAAAASLRELAGSIPPDIDPVDRKRVALLAFIRRIAGQEQQAG
jgi:hypothetical protein